MYSQSQELLRDYHENEEEEEASNSGVSPTTCSEGQRSMLFLRTKQGGSICLLCFSNPQSPTVHVSYALSQLSQAISSDPPFLRSLLAFHPHFLVSPLVHALSSLDDDPIARQVVHLISALCDSAAASLSADFVSRVSDRLSSGALAWSRRELFTALMKTQSDDVRLNCVAFFTVLAQTQRGLFGAAYAVDLNSMSSSEGDSFEQATENGKDVNPMNMLFTEAIKGPLLSTDSQVQISTLDLLFHYMSSWEGTSGKETQVLVEENIADYVFEILRLSG